MPRRLRLSATARNALVAEACAADPAECCGLLAGSGDVVERIYPVPNAARERPNQYEMAPAEMWAARRRAAADGYEVLGFYHSHPRTAPVPSSYDVERAYYPDAIYAIVGPSAEPRVRAYRISGGHVEEVEVVAKDAADPGPASLL
jgi:proteasome lid subunit RPN8/RPN11